MLHIFVIISVKDMWQLFSKYTLVVHSLIIICPFVVSFNSIMLLVYFLHFKSKTNKILLFMEISLDKLRPI